MPRLGPIRCVTVATADVQRMIDAYQLYLGYELVDHGKVPPTQARLWGRPALSGRHYALMLPEGTGSTYFRFIESKPVPQYRAFRHMGWNAAELMVQDTDACAARLANSPFQIIGPPADLSFSDKIRAMQVLGPARESLYLTSFKQKLPEFDTPDAHCFIDRTFIVIVGGPSVRALGEFYTEQLGVAPAPAMRAVISVLSSAHGLPADTMHELAALALHGQSYIEADTMPAGTLPRASDTDELPPAIAMVSFGIDSLESTRVPLIAAAGPLSLAPYQGRRAAVCIGAGGELIELIEQ